MILNTKPPKPYRKPNGKYVAQVRKPDGRRTKITLVDDLALSQRIIADAYRAFDAVKSEAAVAGSPPKADCWSNLHTQAANAKRCALRINGAHRCAPLRYC
jgi:hypothetical protein